MSATPEEVRMRSEAAAVLEKPLLIEKQIREVMAERKEIEESVLHGIDYSRTGGRSADQTSRTERAALKIAELDELHERLCDEWFDADSVNMEIISKAYYYDARAALHLLYHYVSGRSIAEIESITGYSREYIRQIKNHALLVAYKVMNDPEPTEPECKEDVP